MRPAKIEQVENPDNGEYIGWLATIDHKYNGVTSIIYAIGNTRAECVERLKRALVAFNEYDWNGPPGGWKSGNEEAKWRYFNE